jgi:RluA family pseudouridine synthase
LRVGLLGPEKPPMPAFPPVIFEDDTLIAFDKPSGLPVSPEPRARTSVCLMTLVQEKFGAGLANVHRTDADASGLVLCTKTKQALDFVSGQFQSKTVENFYEALVVGAPETDTYSVDLVLKEDEAAPERMCIVKKHGKAARTDFKVLARYGRFSHLECRLLTARKHQIRVHLSASGTPILNDPVYGDETRLLLSEFKRGYKGREEERPLIARLALHASRLTIIHPVSRERMTLVAPLPKDLSVALKYLGRFTQ